MHVYADVDHVINMSKQNRHSFKFSESSRIAGKQFKQLLQCALIFHVAFCTMLTVSIHVLEGLIFLVADASRLSGSQE